MRKISTLLAVLTLLMSSPLTASAATTIGNNVSVGGTFAVAGATTLTGSATIVSTLTVSGNLSVSSTMTVNSVASNLVPATHMAYDLGSLGTTWRYGYISSTLYVGAGTTGGEPELTITGTGVYGNSSTSNLELNSWYSQVYIQGNGGIRLSDSTATAVTFNYLNIIGGTANNSTLGTFTRSWGSVMSSGTVFSASSTISNTGTTTQYIASRTSAKGGQIVLKGYDGNCYAVYMGNTNGAMTVTSTLTPCL